MNSKAFLFFGRSGCGKGTQAKLLTDYIESKGGKVIYIETGGKFREIAKAGSYAGTLIEEIFNNGGLIPVFLPIWVWGGKLIDEYTGKESIVLDGVCRRLEEAIAFESATDFYNISKPNIILINVSKEWSFSRMMERRRADDTPEKIQNRLDWFEKDVMPSIEYFKNKDKFNFIEINGEQTIEEVHRDIIEALKL